MLLKLGPALLMRHGAKAETWTEIEIIRKCYSQKFSNKSLRGKKTELRDKGRGMPQAWPTNEVHREATDFGKKKLDAKEALRSGNAKYIYCSLWVLGTSQSSHGFGLRRPLFSFTDNLGGNFFFLPVSLIHDIQQVFV